MRFLLPQGIGDSAWVLLKLQSIAKGLGSLNNECLLACHDESDPVEKRALEFVSRFSFVDKTGLYKTSIVNDISKPSSSDGYWDYVDDNRLIPNTDIYILLPNKTLEHGKRLEEWMPDYGINWRIMDNFLFKDAELEFAEKFLEENAPYCVFFASSKQGNTTDGHNRGPLWTPDDWMRLSQLITSNLGIHIVLVGAPYDRSYFTDMIEPYITSYNIQWRTFFDWHVAQTIAVMKGAKFVISYQSGIGILSSLLGVPTGIFWRKKGDSISRSFYVSYEEEMASGWANPAYIEQGRHLPLIYGKHSVDHIFDQIVGRGWWY